MPNAMTVTPGGARYENTRHRTHNLPHLHLRHFLKPMLLDVLQ